MDGGEWVVDAGYALGFGLAFWSNLLAGVGAEGSCKSRGQRIWCENWLWRSQLPGGVNQDVDGCGGDEMGEAGRIADIADDGEDLVLDEGFGIGGGCGRDHRRCRCPSEGGIWRERGQGKLADCVKRCRAVASAEGPFQFCRQKPLESAMSVSKRSMPSFSNDSHFLFWHPKGRCVSDR